MVLLNILLIWLQIILTNGFKHEKPLSAMTWQSKCLHKSKLLNECNWCTCNKRSQYECTARACTEVDMFGHFNDAIREYDHGMEGHGAWRSKQTSCEPNVSYRRGELLCVCNEDGYWPSPICRDMFRVLHPVTTLTKPPKNYHCTPANRYLIGCNVCVCSSEGRLDPKLCTKNTCSEDDPILNTWQDSDDEGTPNNEILEVYATCNPELKYKLGCKKCICLRNNRLLCDECSKEDSSTDNAVSFCDNLTPWKTFSRECNVCYCDVESYIYCSTRKCLPRLRKSLHGHIDTETALMSNKKSNAGDDCLEGYYHKDCNICFCGKLSNGMLQEYCTLKKCDTRRSVDRIENLHKDCVLNTRYEESCLICNCIEVNGVKTQSCKHNLACKGRQAFSEPRSEDLDSLHGYCEPLHVYKKDCNTCTCLTDGKTVKCTSNICNEVNKDSVLVDIVPVQQNGGSCPKGLSYKIDCNFCFCLSNGNAICTTMDCKKNKE